jgi:hypothetical protein
MVMHDLVAVGRDVIGVHRTFMSRTVIRSSIPFTTRIT